MNQKNLILLATIGLSLSSCLKTSTDGSKSDKDRFAIEARKFFDKSTASGSNLIADYKSGSPRAVLWENAAVQEVRGGRALIAPIEYLAPLFVRTEFSGNRIFNLNNISKLLIYSDSNRLFHLEVLTYLPDSNFLDHPSGIYSGFLFADDWWGNSIGKYILGKGAMQTYHSPKVQSETIIQTCNVVYGYNYSTGDPGGGYSWVQNGGCYYMYIPDRLGDVHGGLGGGLGGGAGSGGGSGIGSSNSNPNITLAPPDNPIANIADYIKCFTNVGGADHSYTVTICVQQPIPGNRAAYKWVDGGPIGSSNEGNIVNVGHTFLIFTEQYGNTTITRNIGFYPASGVKPGSSTAPGKLNNDEAHSYNISANFSVTNASFFTMLNNVTKGNNPVFYYDLSSENCTTFALQTLARGGINLPNTIGSWPGGMGCNPGDLGEDIRQMTPLPNMTKATIQNFHPNTGNCQ